MKQTAVEWLFEQLYDGKELSTVIRQAKEMEKEQMLDFCWTHSFMTFPDIEDKFNETFKRQQK
jgi:hypothetical protein